MKTIAKLTLNAFLTLFLFACDSDAEIAEASLAVEDTAFAIVEDILASSLDSRTDVSGPYQHRDLTISRLEEKALSQDAIDDGVTALWCAGVSYEITSNEGDDAGSWRDAEIIVLVFEQGARQLGGGEWLLQSAEAQPETISDYNNLAYEECLAR